MMELVIWDVQHGSSAYLKTPLGKNIVIDLGTGDYTSNKDFSPLEYLKKENNINQLDLVIISHPHTDHIDDIFNFDSLSPKVLVRPKHLTEESIINANSTKNLEKIHKYIEINNRYCAPVEEKNNPKKAVNNGGVNIETFIPKMCGITNINNHSVVTLIEYLGYKILIPGDNESPSWKELLDDKKFINSIKNTNIFIASHHGRESGYYSELFNHFKPELVVLSDGPYSETSATEKYGKIAKGYRISKRSDNEKIPFVRKCLTTRKDGTIVLKVFNRNDKNYMNITIE